MGFSRAFGVYTRVAGTSLLLYFVYNVDRLMLVILWSIVYISMYSMY